MKHIRGATRALQLMNTIAQKSLPSYNGTPKSVFEFDWDNLIILDACRHDLYEEVMGPTTKRVTLGSSSDDYIQNTYSTENFSDTVYVSGNLFFHEPQFRELTGRSPNHVFHRLYETYLHGWDENHNTVLPEAVVSDAEKAMDEYPKKRKVLHFMQPHIPFVPCNLAKDSNDHVWELCEQKQLDAKTAWKAYRKNLEYVLPYALRIGKQLPGRTVITADHGNLVGESGLFAHPSGSDAAVLREVPWHVLKE